MLKQLFNKIPYLSFLLYCICIVLIAVSEILVPIFEQRIIDSLWNTALYKGGYVLLTGVGIGLNGVFYFWLYFIFTKTKNGIIKDISSSLVQRLVLFNNKNIRHKGCGVYTAFLSREPEQIACCSDPSGLFFIISLMIATVAVCISVTWSYVFLYLLPAVIAAYCFFDCFFSKKLEYLINAIITLNYTAEPQCIDYIKNAKTILKFGHNKYYCANLECLEKNAIKLKKQYVYYKELKNGLSDIISSIAFVAFIGIAAYDIIAGTLTYGGFTVLLSYFGLLLVPIVYHGKYKMILIDAERSYELLQSINKECGQEIRSYQSINLLIPPVLSARNLCVSYTESTAKGENMKYDYSDISFSLEEGDSLGIIGISGEGKSTVVKLLLGELIPSSGSITINGCDISKIPQPILNYLICVYEQTNTVVNGTLYDNICLGRQITDMEHYSALFNKIKTIFERAILEKKWCAELSELFGIDGSRPRQLLPEEKQFVDSFYTQNPNAEFLAHVYCDKIAVNKNKVDSLITSFGLSHLHGRNLGENGSDISGGEKERISMVRFLTKEHAFFYIIDEPFTSLDSRTEDECLQLLCKEMCGKTVLVISHKFNVIRALTKECAVLKDGGICEYGTHTELEKNSGLYAELLRYFNAQRHIE